MLQVKDYVMFGSTGVCQITNIIRERFGGKSDREYYVLNPLHVNSATIYVPTDHQNANFRRILSKDEIHVLIQTISDIESDWIDDDSSRKSEFNEIIQSCDQRRMVQLIQMIHSRKAELEENGKKLTGVDTETMKMAEMLLFNEFALVLDILPDQVLPFILGQRQASR